MNPEDALQLVLTRLDECEILHYGIMVKVREKRRIGYVPLADLEVSPKSDLNYWPVREYVEWFGNR